jgi:VanZ family protein
MHPPNDLAPGPGSWIQHLLLLAARGSNTNRPPKTQIQIPHSLHLLLRCLNRLPKIPVPVQRLCKRYQHIHHHRATYSLSSMVLQYLYSLGKRGRASMKYRQEIARRGGGS